MPSIAEYLSTKPAPVVGARLVSWGDSGKLKSTTEAIREAEEEKEASIRAAEAEIRHLRGRIERAEARGIATLAQIEYFSARIKSTEEYLDRVRKTESEGQEQ